MHHGTTSSACFILLCVVTALFGSQVALAQPHVIVSSPPKGLNKLCAGVYIRGDSNCQYLAQAHPLYSSATGTQRGAVVIDIFPTRALPTFETVINLPAQSGGGQFLRDVSEGDVSNAIANFTLGTDPSVRRSFVRYKQDAAYNAWVNGANPTFPEEITFAIPFHLSGQLELAGDTLSTANQLQYRRYVDGTDEYTLPTDLLDLGSMPPACRGKFYINKYGIPAATESSLLDMNCDNPVARANGVYGCALSQNKFADVSRRRQNFTAEAGAVFENLVQAAMSNDDRDFTEAGTGFWSTKYPQQYGTFTSVGRGIPPRDVGNSAPVWATITYEHPSNCLVPGPATMNGRNSLQFVWTQGVDVDDQDVAEAALPALIRHRIGDKIHQRVVYIPYLQGRPKIVRPLNSGLLAPRVVTRPLCRNIPSNGPFPNVGNMMTAPPTNFPQHQLFHLASVTGLPYTNVMMYAKWDFEYPTDSTLAFSVGPLYMMRGQAVQLTGVNSVLSPERALLYFTGPLATSTRAFLYEEATIGGELLCNCIDTSGSSRRRCPTEPCPIVRGQSANMNCQNSNFLSGIPTVRAARVNAPFSLNAQVQVSADSAPPACGIFLLNGYDGSPNSILLNGTHQFRVDVYPPITPSNPATVRWSALGLSQLQGDFLDPLARTDFTGLFTVNFRLTSLIQTFSVIAQVQRADQIGTCRIDLRAFLGAPIAVLIPARFAMNPNQAVFLLGNFSVQLTGEPLTYSWSITYASTRNTGFLNTTGDSPVVTFSATAAGEFSVSMTVTNPRQISRSVTAVIIVQNTPINRTALTNQLDCVTSLNMDPAMEAPLSDIMDNLNQFAPINTAPGRGSYPLQEGEEYLPQDQIVRPPDDPFRSPAVPNPDINMTLNTVGVAGLIAFAGFLALAAVFGTRHTTFATLGQYLCRGSRK